MRSSERIDLTAVFRIQSGEPDFVPAEDAVLHCGHVVRSEEQLSSVSVDLRVCKKPYDIAEKLRMQLGIQLINDYQTSLLQGHQDDRKSGKELAGSVGLTGKRELIERIMQGSLQVNLYM